MKKTLAIGAVLLMNFALAGTAFAHAIVEPNQAGVAAFETFSLGVPSEKPEATVAVKLLMPPGLSEVVPNVKPGWQISTKTDANDNVTEIDWTGGSIPADERDSFSFSAQVPGTPTTLVWKAYQTYADGSIVSWDQTPTGGDDDDSGDTGPYSQTMVVNDLAPTPAPASSSSPWTEGIAIAALALSVFTLIRTNAKAR